MSAETRQDDASAASSFTFRVDDRVFQRFPDYVVGCVSTRGIDNGGSYPMIDGLQTQAEADARERFGGSDLKSVREVAAWRDAFTRAGWTPSKYPSSLEALLKRVMRGDALPRLNPVVDLVNAMVLQFGVPIGAHDTLVLPEPELAVREAVDDDAFLPMGDGAAEMPDAGEIVYASGRSVRTRRWVWRQSREALVTADTSNLFFPIDGFRGSTDELVLAATANLAELVTEVFGVAATTGLVSAESTTFNFGN